VDDSHKRNRDEDEDSNVNNSRAKKLATDSKATEARLVKLIESLADDLDAKVTLTKGDIVTLIQMLVKQCMEKFREAMEAGAENIVIVDVDNKDNDLHNVDKSDMIDVDKDSENGDPRQPIKEDATNDCYFYSNRSVTICSQEINVPISHDVISRSYNSRLKKSAWLANKIKKKCIKVKQYHSSQLGRCYYNSASYQTPCFSMYAVEQISPLVIAGFLADAGIAFDAKAIASSCPSARTLNLLIVDGSIDSILWLEDQLQDAAAIFIACGANYKKNSWKTTTTH
jgi:hypothetical protein